MGSGGVTDTLTRNWSLIEETLRVIIAHPERWEQRHYVDHCGTTYCFAGHAVVLAGYTFIVDEDGDTRSCVPMDESMKQYGLTPGYSEYFGTEFVTVDALAQCLLGLSWGEARDLFRPYCSLDDIIAFLRALYSAEGRSLPPDLDLSPEQVQHWYAEAVVSGKRAPIEA